MTGTATSATIDLDREHIADSAFWAAAPAHRHAVFAALRHEQPVRWYEPRRSAFQRSCSGFWAITRYDDVREASRNPALFCSGLGIDIEESPEELGTDRSSMINFDDPQHFTLRRLVSSAFTPGHVAALDGALRATATRIVDDVLEHFGGGEPFDLVEHVSSRLPLEAICDLLGIPADERAQLSAWTNTTIAVDDPSVGIGPAVSAATSIDEYAIALGRERLRRPTSDLTSALMHASVDGERLSERDFANFFGLLIAAGNETTRNSISHGLMLLTEHEDQRVRWFGDFDRLAPTAVEEIVRLESPITHMCRVLTADATVRDVELPAGSKVALWYTSANRDETAFERPDEFDVGRPTNPQQMGYGGGGPHFCLGANLARREITVMFDEIRRRVPTLSTVGEPERLVSMSGNSIRSVPAAIRPTTIRRPESSAT